MRDGGSGLVIGHDVLSQGWRGGVVNSASLSLDRKLESEGGRGGRSRDVMIVGQAAAWTNSDYWMQRTRGVGDIEGGALRRSTKCGGLKIFFNTLEPLTLLASPEYLNYLLSQYSGSLSNGQSYG
jgi:hypothetical protein